MNKTQLIAQISEDAFISNASAGRALEATISAVKMTLKKGGFLSLSGFGTFRSARRASRIGRNPKTGESLRIKAANVPKFTPGKAFKESIK